jgi:hypothetical protein
MPISGDVIALYETSSSLLCTDCRPLKTEGAEKNLSYSEKGRIGFSWGIDKVSAPLSLTLVVLSRLCFSAHYSAGRTREMLQLTVKTALFVNMTETHTTGSLAMHSRACLRGSHGTPWGTAMRIASDEGDGILLRDGLSKPADALDDLFPHGV